jgi:Uma2 family endonuclease
MIQATINLMVAALQSTTFHPPREFANGAEWLAELGNVPLDRIIFNPWPGTATEADLLRMVENDKRLCELIDGTLVEKPGYWEGLIAANLVMILGVFVRDHDLGAVFGPDSTMRMKSGRVRLPDVSFVEKSRLPRVRAAIPTLSPDLAIEVLSEGNTSREMELKLTEYFQSGTRLAWIVDPRTRTVSIFHSAARPTRVLEEHANLDGEQVLIGLSFSITEIFRNVPRAE